jgi:predicted HTH domain antitoxin
MYTITLNVPDEALQALQTTPENLSQDMLLIVAVKLYELERLSSGAAADLAGLARPVFLTKLADYGVDTFRLTEAELVEDFTNA